MNCRRLEVTMLKVLDFQQMGLVPVLPWENCISYGWLLACTLKYTSTLLGTHLYLNLTRHFFMFSVHGLTSVLCCRRDVIEIETWSQNEGRIGTRRDWILNEVATGEVIGRATRFISSPSFPLSLHIRRFITWNQSHMAANGWWWTRTRDGCKKLVMMSRKNISSSVHENLGMRFPSTQKLYQYHLCDARVYRLAFSEKNNKSLKRIAKLEDPVRYSKLGLKVRSQHDEPNNNKRVFVVGSLNVPLKFRSQDELILTWTSMSTT